MKVLCSCGVFAKRSPGRPRNGMPRLLDMLLQPVEILHAQEREAVVPRVGARIGFDRAPLEVAHQLQDAAEAEGNAVVQDPHRLRAEHFRVPAGGLAEVAARHGDVGDVAAAGGDRRVVQQARRPA